MLKTMKRKREEEFDKKSLIRKVFGKGLENENIRERCRKSVMKRVNKNIL